MTMVSPAQNGGAISTRTFIPAHLPFLDRRVGRRQRRDRLPAAGFARGRNRSVGEGDRRSLSIEHPTGEMTVVATLDADGSVKSAAILRTARKLFDGMVFGE